MKHQKLLSYVRKAVEDYGMISAQDHIAVGVSGGKDSLCTLLALASLRRFYPAPFRLTAITVSMGLEGMDFSPVAQLCETIEVPYSIVETDIGPIIFDERKEKNPCSLCSKMRKGALHDRAQQLGCNKIALGHNKDDILETFFLSLFYEGRIHTFAPKSFLDRKQLWSIRPLMYVPEGEIRSYVRQNNLPIVKNPCPADGTTKRQQIKELIASLSKEYDNLEGKVFSAIRHSAIPGWAPPKGR